MVRMCVCVYGWYGVPVLSGYVATRRSDGLSHRLSMEKLFDGVFDFPFSNLCVDCTIQHGLAQYAIGRTAGRKFRTINYSAHIESTKCVWTHIVQHISIYLYDYAYTLCVCVCVPYTLHIHPVASFMRHIIWSNSSVLIVMRPIYARFSDTLPDIKLYPHQNVTTISTHKHTHIGRRRRRRRKRNKQLALTRKVRSYVEIK